MKNLSECPAPIQDLCQYLIKCDTGKAKIDKVIEIGLRVNGAEQFLVEAAKVLPEGTMAKIHTFIELQKTPTPSPSVEPKQEQTPQEPTTNTLPQEDSSVVKSNPVSGMNASDAIEFIKLMDDKAMVQLVLDMDGRKTVLEAASKQLDALNKPLVYSQS